MIPLSKTKIVSVIGLFSLLLILNHAAAIPCDETTPCGPHEICDNDGKCYPRVFQPADEFQVVREGQEIPRAINSPSTGLHVRIDLSTGLKEAKLMDPTDSNNGSALIFDNAHEKVHYIPWTDSESPGFYTDSDGHAVDSDGRIVDIDPPTQHVLKASSSAGSPKYLVNVGDDDLFDACVMVLSDVDTTAAEALQALDGLEELVHQIDLGVKLAEGDGMGAVMRWLYDGDAATKSGAAMVIGAAVQNNPTAQRLATQFDLIPRLLQRIYLDSDPLSQERLMYALSNLIRGNPPAIRRLLLDSSYLDLLLTAYSQRPAGDVFQLRAAVMFADVLDPRMGGLDPAAEGEVFGCDLADTKPETQIVLELWQRAFEATVMLRKDALLDLREKVVAAVVTIKGSLCKGVVYGEDFVAWIREQRDWVRGEDQDGLEEYTRLLNVVLRGFVQAIVSLCARLSLLSY
ncbi:hypothetical protein BC937DRAFT_87299 [Endogone sp. FLAS-F59071]|nr:hypothetical protein BC937DRAFT_87299 [Endogone sp. FLAS-F59071]|eukprot:RUS19552.1 hypothetical protein BC937DRAFT_87299 [Endogone sp. FLAS-F59071]